MPMSQDTAMHHPAAEICHTRTASTTVLPAHGDQCDRASWCPAHRGGYPRSTTQCGGRLVGRKEAAFGQCSAGAARARRGECSCRCRSTVPVGVNDSTSARKVSCSGRAAQLVMWVHREAMKPAYVCVVECLSGSVWRWGQCPAAIDSRAWQNQNVRSKVTIHRQSPTRCAARPTRRSAQPACGARAPGARRSRPPPPPPPHRRFALPRCEATR